MNEGITFGQTEEKSDQGCQEETPIRFHMPSLRRRIHTGKATGRFRPRRSPVWGMRPETRVHGDAFESDSRHLLHVHGLVLWKGEAGSTRGPEHILTL